MPTSDDGHTTSHNLCTADATLLIDVTIIITVTYSCIRVAQVMLYGLKG